MGVERNMKATRCQRSRLWSSARLDASLNDFEAILLDRHLRRCAACRHFAAEIATQTKLLRSTEVAEMQVPVEAAWAGSARSGARRKLTATAVAFAAAAAAAAVLIGGNAPSPAPSAVSAVAAAAAQDDSLGVPKIARPGRRSSGDVMRGEPGVNPTAAI